MVKQGYKQTEIGVIPEEWKIASLKDLSDGRFTYGVNAPAIPYAPPLPNYIRITDISDDGRFMRESRTSVDCQNPEMYTLKENDIVFARTGASTGKTYLYRKNDGDLVYAGFLIKASILPEKANSKYVFDNLHTNRYWDWVSVTSMRSGQPGINGNEYASYMIPCPSLPEQEHIAEALSDVDGMISSLEKLIAKKKAVKQGAMQELLMGKKRLPGFTGEWKKIELENIGSITGSGVDKKILPGEKAITLLNYTNVFRQTSINRTDLNHQVTASDEKIKNCSVLKGDVFLTPTSETPEDIALSAVALEDMPDVVYSYHVIRLRPNSSHNGRFINYALSTPIFRAQAVQYAEGSGIRYVITLKKFKEMQVYVPIEKAEQEAIASILSDMDNEIEALEQKLDKTRQIKQGMMQQLLTGKIRLTEEAVATSVVENNDQVATPKTQTNHNHQFDDAVMIAAIVNSFYSPKYRLGRKKVQKLLYLLRRKQEADTSAFKKKAAGPYADEVRYKGGEPIAKHNGYIETKKNNKGTLFFIGPKMASALEYIAKWQMQDSMDWLVKTFKYIGVEELELLATVDMAMCDLVHAGIEVSVDSIKQLIRSNEEWKAKLKKVTFSDDAIARAIEKCRELFGY